MVPPVTLSADDPVAQKEEGAAADVPLTGAPEQGVLGITLTEVVLMDVHPTASVTVTVYVPVLATPEGFITGPEPVAE